MNPMAHERQVRFAPNRSRSSARTFRAASSSVPRIKRRRWAERRLYRRFQVETSFHAAPSLPTPSTPHAFHPTPSTPHAFHTPRLPHPTPPTPHLAHERRENRTHRERKNDASERESAASDQGAARSASTAPQREHDSASTTALARRERRESRTQRACNECGALCLAARQRRVAQRSTTGSMPQRCCESAAYSRAGRPTKTRPRTISYTTCGVFARVRGTALRHRACPLPCGDGSTSIASAPGWDRDDAVVRVSRRCAGVTTTRG